MKMNYRSRRKRISVLIIIVIFSILVFGRPSMPNWLTSVTHYVGYPFWTVKQAITNNVTLQTKKSLIEENRKLKSRVETLVINEISNDILREENISLKEILGRSIYNNAILASVLVRPNSTLYDTFIIDIGGNNNVVNGDYVIINGDVVIGYVEETYSNTSLVKLFSSPGEETDIIIGEDNIATIAHGVGGGNFTVSLPRGVVVKVGDPIITPTIETQLFATVEEIISNPIDSFQTILFKNPVNISNIRFVQVMHLYEE